MQEDIVDFEDFDYGDLDDINPDDLDIENLERELGLLNEDKKKKNENKEASIDASGKNELEQKDTNVSIEQDKSSHVTSSTDSKKPESMPEKSSTSSTSASASINASTTTATKATPVKQQYQQRQQRSFNNNRPPYNNNNQMRGGFGGQYRPPNTSFPHQQYPFAQQGMMGMNMIMPPHMNMQMPFPGMNPMMMGFNPQRPPPGKIHINPKFAAMQQQQQHLLQLQQQQLQFQQQLQQQQQHKQQQQGGFRPTPTGDVSQDEINRQRQQLLEMQRKRQAQKGSSSATAATGSVDTSSSSSTPKTTKTQNKDESSKIQSQSVSSPLSQKRKVEEEGEHGGDECKRPMTIRGLANKGITIKGAAAAASTSTISGTTKEQSRGSSSPMQKRTGGILDRISSPKQQQELSQPKSILDRISSPSKTNATVSHLNGGGGKKKPSSPAMDQQNRSSPLNRIGRQRGEASPTPPPSSTSGKATTLLIKNLSDSTTEADIRQFGQAIPGGITHVALDKQQAKVTLKNPESAVLFRRKYNRTALKGSHIVISFS